MHVRTHSFPTRRSCDLRTLKPRSHARRRVGQLARRLSHYRRSEAARAGCRGARRAARGRASDADVHGAGVAVAALDAGRAQEPQARRWLNRAAPLPPASRACPSRSEEHTSELQSLMRISYAVFCLKKKKTQREK